MDALCERARAGFRGRGALALGALLVVAVAVGGSSRGHGPGEGVAQLAALATLAWVLLGACAPDAGVRRLPRAPLVVAAAIVLLVAALQLPIPLSLWEMPQARAALASDLQAVGVSPSAHWALAPLASERALWFLLPAVALFAGVLFVDPGHLRGLLLLVVAVGVASLVLGAMQMAAPRDSIVNPYPQWAPAFNGVFENPNHQASLLAVCATIVAALPWRPRDTATRFRQGAPAWFLAAAIAAAGVLATGSRAGVGLAVLGVGAALALRWRHAQQSGGGVGRSGRFLVPGTALLLAVGGVIAFRWLDLSDSVRWSLVQATAAMARDHAPLGAGFGTFPGWFDQAAPAALVQWEYFNHAHNEYVQWWFELGIAGLACVLAALAILATLHPRPGRTPGVGAGAGFGVPLAAWLGCVLFLLHSLVEYALRTPALLSVGALLAGVLVASHARVPRNPRIPPEEQR